MADTLAYNSDLAALGQHAASLVPDGSTVGLGSGRAALAFVDALGARVHAGLGVRGVPTSEVTAARAREVGIPLADLDHTVLEMTVDGADEVDRNLDLIKGWGGALVRERVVAAASRRQIILVTVDKLVPRLGTRGRLPVEIVPFARPLCERALRALGCHPTLRTAHGMPFVSDNGNLILDCAVEPLDDPPGLEQRLRRVAGVVDTGLFLGTASTVLVAEQGAVRALDR